MRSLILFLLLVACSPTDPRVMVAAGNAALVSTQQAAAQSTAAESARLARVTLSARQTADAYAYQSTALAVTAQAGNVLSTQQASAWTATAVDSERAFASELRYARQTEITQGQIDSVRASNRRNALLNLGVGALFLLAYGLVAVLLVSLYRRWNAQTKLMQEQAAYRLAITDQGYAFRGPDGMYKLVGYDVQRPRVIPQGRSWLEKLRETPQLPPSSARDRLLEFLRLAARVNGGNTEVIPSKDRMAIGASGWQERVNELVDLELARTEAGVGTYLEGYKVNELIAAIEVGEVSVE
jgi:hypothetical protein